MKSLLIGFDKRIFLMQLWIVGICTWERSVLRMVVRVLKLLKNLKYLKKQWRCEVVVSGSREARLNERWIADVDRRYGREERVWSAMGRVMANRNKRQRPADQTAIRSGPLLIGLHVGALGHNCTQKNHIF